ncbi:MAG TPA: hypothetical protein GXX31_01260 [Methanothermobacter sp.]|uniref:Uncharacterized protein n=1 Tax=Methanothermobacter tenebrarum TaxID=680118 RepID=A0ABM7YFP9_9EURY|nr:hypothetical protein [Methanothermobacter tenebrarum]BDH80209.1 hypothetical protein MTTB_15880 [Methanothermobacter tenebrarum]HHW16001.1 hypothetical protein [Methanothermobacter sp.]
MIGDKDYVLNGTILLLIIPVFILFFSTLTVLDYENKANCDSINSNNVLSTFKDVKDNIPVITLDVLNKSAYQVIEENLTIINSREYVKEKVQERINKLNYDCDVNCTIKTITSYEKDPFYIEVNSTITVKKGNIKHAENISQLVSIEGLPDPLPFTKCDSISHNLTRIEYHHGLAAYLGDVNGSFYENATSPFIIKKCPYEPYETHGSTPVIIDCIQNGYYHQSNDGACYLCRLEGKATCPHQGLETFIIPHILNNGSTIVSVDHVIFGDLYEGSPFIVNSTYILFLDQAHRKKYGIK